MGLLATGLSHAQFNESFETGTTFPAGWTVINGGDANTWTVVDLSTSELNAVTGNKIASIQYNTTTAHADYLITPAITVTAGTSNMLSFYGRSRDPQYPETISVRVSTTTPTAAAFTGTLAATVAPASGPNFVFYQYDLSQYAGQTIYIGFYSATTDKFVFDLDDVSVSALPACANPSGFAVAAPAPTTSTFNIQWSAPMVGGTPQGYQVEYGPDGFVQGTGQFLNPTTPVANFTQLASGTDYDFYVRTNCGNGSYGAWVGPLGFTTVFAPASTPYSYGFETANLNGWDFLDAVATGGTWNVYTTNATYPAQEGTRFAAATGATDGVSNTWIFSRGLNLTAGTAYTLQYYARKANLVGTTAVSNLTVKAGMGKTALEQSITLQTLTNYAPTTYTLQTATFTPTTSGVYYIGFNYTSPAHTAAQTSGIFIDNVSFNATAGNDEFLSSKLSIYPNPANDVINVSNADNILINGAEIVDLNGRTVKVAKFNGVSEAQINISDLASGMYMMTVSSDQGTLTKKIVKQ